MFHSYQNLRVPGRLCLLCGRSEYTVLGENGFCEDSFKIDQMRLDWKQSNFDGPRPEKEDYLDHGKGKSYIHGIVNQLNEIYGARIY